MDKSNEITAIPALLDELELAGSTVSIDAMGCQHGLEHVIHQRAQVVVEGFHGLGPRSETWIGKFQNF